MAIVKNQFFRLILYTIGIVSVIIGTIGIFVPILPTTPFILLAAWCFLKSSKTTYKWISRQPLFGKALKDWNENEAISRKNKTLAISMISISLILIWQSVDDKNLLYIVTILLLLASVFIITRNDVK